MKIKTQNISVVTVDNEEAHALVIVNHLLDCLYDEMRDGKIICDTHGHNLDQDDIDKAFEVTQVILNILAAS